MTFAEKIEHLLEKQGRKKTWLAYQLGISKVVLHNKLKDERFDSIEQARIRKLLGHQSTSEYKEVMEA